MYSINRIILTQVSITHIMHHGNIQGPGILNHINKASDNNYMFPTIWDPLCIIIYVIHYSQNLFVEVIMILCQNKWHTKWGVAITCGVWSTCDGHLNCHIAGPTLTRLLCICRDQHVKMPSQVYRQLKWNNFTAPYVLGK